MKILIVSSYFGNIIGGALNFIKDLTEELSLRGHSVTLLLDERYKNFFSINDVKIIWFTSTKITAYSLSLSFLKILLKIDVDVIHLHGYMSFQTDLGALIGYLRRIPVILTPHGSILGYDHLYDSWTNKLPYYFHDLLTLKLPPKFSKYIIVTSNAEFKDCIKFGIPENKIRLIPLSFSLPEIINDQKQYSDKKLKLLFVGRIVPLKNLEVLIRSISVLKKDFPDVELTIVGDEIKGRLKGDVGYKKQLQTLIKKLDIDENIKFVGWKTNNDLWKIYQNSDLFLFASTYENFGLPLLEAASFGIPLLSTDVGVARELIGNNQGGFIIDELSEYTFIKKILYFQNNGNYSKSSEFVKTNSKNFLISYVTDKYEQIFNKFINID